MAAQSMITILVSDIHLGARNNRTDLLAELLRSDFDRLILNGDTVDSMDFRRFRPRDWRIVHKLREIALERELILVRGNHDGQANEDHFHALDALADFLGTQWHEEYELAVRGDRYLVLHGDQFDHTLNLSWVGDAADWFYRQTQRASTRFAHFLKGRVKHWGGVNESVRDGAIRYARQNGFSGVITGHTHFCHDEIIEEVHYLNSGCWVDWPCTFIRADEISLQLCKWPAENRLPQERRRMLAAVSA
jgi:UDP-2,3-diacylglucosamine pyrophosphatase LpxH